VPDDVLSDKQKWDAWIKGLEQDVQEEVKRVFYRQEQH
jgi:hypothetical protein